MNSLLSGSFSRYDQDGNQSPPPDSHSIEMTTDTTTGGNLEKFFEDVETIKEELQGIETIYGDLQASHENSKTIYNAKAIKDLHAKMDNDVASALKKAKFIKASLGALDQSNEQSRKLRGCGPGSSSDRTRTSVVSGLRKQLQETMQRFNELRETMASEYRETIQRRYFTVTGENPDESLLDDLISTGQSETLLQKAIQEQGRGQVMDTIMEIQERHDAVKDLEKNLKELHQVFLDMSVMVQHQGVQLDDIESQILRANSYVQSGTKQLVVAKKHQRNTRKWTCFALILLLIIILIIVLSLQPWK